MNYAAPVKEILFTLEHVVDFRRLESSKLPESGMELLPTIFGEAGRFASEVLAPLNRIGDVAGARLTQDSVTSSPGFAAAFRDFSAQGWIGIAAPEAYGGQGLPITLEMVCHEMWAAANLAWSLCPVLTAGAAETILEYGSDAQKAKFVPKLLSGEWTGTMQLTEPQAGSDLGAIRATAEPCGEGAYRLRGSKIFISWGDHDLAANIIHLVLARVPGDAPGSNGLSLFIVPKFLVNEHGEIGQRNDVRATGVEHKLGIHGSPTCTMMLGQEQGAIGYLLGERGRGLAAMFTMMNRSRLITGLEGVGIGERAYQQALAYARERRQGRVRRQGVSTPIIEHPDVKRMLLVMKSRVEAARAICYATAVCADLAHAGEDATARQAARSREELLIPIAKAWATDGGCEVASLALQIHGGAGYIEETGIAQLVRDSRITAIYEGTNGIQAIDLVTRKLPANDAVAAKALFAEIHEFIDGAEQSSDPSVTEILIAMKSALANLERATRFLLEELPRQPEQVLATASSYLRMFAAVTGGYLLARGASKASILLAGGSPDTTFLRTRIGVARFFAATELMLDDLARAVTRGAHAMDVEL